MSGPQKERKLAGALGGVSSGVGPGAPLPLMVSVICQPRLLCSLSDVYGTSARVGYDGAVMKYPPQTHDKSSGPKLVTVFWEGLETWRLSQREWGSLVPGTFAALLSVFVPHGLNS